MATGFGRVFLDIKRADRGSAYGEITPDGLKQHPSADNVTRRELNFMRRVSTSIVATAMLVTGTVGLQAQEAKYPAKKIDFVVAFAAGGFADTLARFFAQKLNEKWGQPVVVENAAAET